jgi:hypothetical protein
MHTEGEQKFCISHILKNIKARPPSHFSLHFLVSWTGCTLQYFVAFNAVHFSVVNFLQFYFCCCHNLEHRIVIKRAHKLFDLTVVSISMTLSAQATNMVEVLFIVSLNAP